MKNLWAQYGDELVGVGASIHYRRAPPVSPPLLTARQQMQPKVQSILRIRIVLPHCVAHCP